MTTPQSRLRRSQMRDLFFALMGDALIVSLAYSAALVLRFEGAVPTEQVDNLATYIGPVIALFLFSNGVFGIYRQLWRYASAEEVASIVLSTAFPTGIIIIVELVFFTSRPIPLSVVIISWFLTTGWFALSRYRSRLVTGIAGRFEHVLRSSSTRQRVLIIGAGEAGQLVARHLSQVGMAHRYELVGYIDDDPTKIGRRVMGGMVLGSRQAIARIATERAVEVIVIAIHRISGEAIRDVMTRCENTDARLKVLPRSMVDFDGLSRTLELQDIQPEDLMGRAAVPLDVEACQNLVEGQRVLVTGAAGSIGSELCRQLAAFEPEELYLLDINESGLYDLRHEILRLVQVEVQIVLIDVTNKVRLAQKFAELSPQVVFHAAAYKHVPILEDYPEEAVRVNVLGVRNVIDVCKSRGVSRVVVISTDKAVEPTSVMGATKLIAERLVTAQPDHAEISFAIVRFGNVINSRGSVVPLFIQQLNAGEPVAITHPEVARYFMSIPEAISLVIQAAALSDGNDLFVLDMGDPLRIEDLARKLIRMHGLRIEDVPIEYIGLRPGEKLIEVLVGKHETKVPTTSEKIFCIKDSGSGLQSLDDLLDAVDVLIDLASNGNRETLQRRLLGMVQEMTVAPNGIRAL